LSENHAIAIKIGGHPIVLRTTDDRFRNLVAERYAGFIGPSPSSSFEFDIDLLKTFA
jgi:hypothetical protein